LNSKLSPIPPLVAAAAALAAAAQGTPGQPAPGTFQQVGNSLVSAQQAFVGSEDKVYVIDKTENNPAQVAGHPAWAAEYSASSNQGRPMDIITNSFCAGGGVLANGTWLNVGGNQGVWIGGCVNGGFVNGGDITNPTYEFFPPRGAPITSPMLVNSLPANLYPITFLLPSRRALVQANWNTIILDYNAGTERNLPDVPDAVRTYPASAGIVMLPMTPANNWTATIMMCGGTNLKPEQWVTNWDIAQYKASQSCVQISPDVDATWKNVDNLPEPRVMGNLIMLPTGKVLTLNGAGTGVAGYGNDTWAIGQSYADNPTLTPAIFDPSAPAGKQWSRDGISASTIPRMYHSVATLLADGSVWVSGSNPNDDYNTLPDLKYPTEYRVENFYPSYFSSRRPQPNGLPTQLGYGGASFDVQLSADDMFHDVGNAKDARVVVMRFGFSTHAMNMGQRLVQLESTITVAADGSATLHCSQLPPNPAVFPPGPAYVFVVVNEPVSPASGLPPASTAAQTLAKPDGGDKDNDSKSDRKNAATQIGPFKLDAKGVGAALGLVGAVLAMVYA
ncbi:hypothetical protein EWM64_g10617, partial [Hericium alpestre]